MRVRRARVYATAAWAAALLLASLLLPQHAMALTPVTTVFGVPDGWSPTDVQFWFVVDAPDPTVQTWYGMNGAEINNLYNPLGLPITVSAEGISRVMYFSLGEGCCDSREPMQSRSIYVDKTAPVSRISGLPTGTVAPGSYPFSIDATDALSGVAATYYSLDGGTRQTAVRGAPIALVTSSTVSIDYWSVDAAGNAEAIRTAVLTVDDGTPATTITGAPRVWTSADVTFTLSAHSRDNTITATSYRLDAGSWTPYAGPVHIATEGTTTVSYYSTDDVGRVESTRTAQIRIDRTPPVSAIAGAPSDWVTSPVTFSLSATDAFSGVASLRYRINGGIAQVYVTPVLVSASGTTTVTYWAVDGAGNGETPHGADIRIDAGPNTACLGIPLSWSSTDVTLTMLPMMSHYPVATTRYAMAPSAETTYLGPIHVTAEGQTSITYFSKDDHGRIGPVWTSLVRIDKTPPTSVAGGFSAGWTKLPVTLTISGADSVSSVATLRYQLAGGPAQDYASPVTVSADGITSLTYWAIDVAGNAEAPHTTSIKIDRTAPTTGVSGIPAGWSAANVTFALSPSDGGSGVMATSYQLGSGPVTDYTSPVTIATEGTTTLTYWSTDTAGNAEGAHSATIRISKEAPTTTASGIPAGWTNANVTATLSATSPHYTVNHTYYHSGSGSDALYTAPVSVTAEGTTILSFHSSDTAGNIEGEKTATVRIDKTAPSSMVSGIPATPAGAVTFTLSGTDALSGIASLHYRLGGGVDQVYTTPVLVASSTTLEYWAIDNAGNAEAHHTIAITTAKPTCTLTIKTTKTSAALGTQFILSGLITPSPAAIGKLMHVDIKKPGKAYWSYSSARVVYSASGAAAWQYKYTLTRTMARGTYTFRAVYDGADFAYGVSRTISVRVF